jgi:RND family efflux transporter MFP subunit
LTVAAATVERGELSRELVFDSELRPYQEIDLHAKVAGYLQNIGVDIGDVVKEGQLIALLELPEAENELDRAMASQRRSEEEIKRAEAAYEEVHLTFTRLAAIDKVQPHLLAQQDLDTAQAKEKTAFASVASAREQANVSAAEVKKLRTMLAYARITAPFSGVITKRYADKGALIQAGTSSSTQALPLVRLSQIDKLRMVFPVSISAVSEVHSGQPVEIRVPALKKILAATITRSAHRMDSVTRTMEVEIDIPNPGGELIPGMYASVSLQVEGKTNALTVPVEALARQKSGNSVFVINSSGTIEEHAVQLGLETPTRVEVLSGLSEKDLVMIGSRTQVKPGQKVTPKLLNLHGTDN